MRWICLVACLLILCCPSWAHADPYVDPTVDDLLGEEQWLQSMGLRLPQDGLWTITPFYEPWTNQSFLLPHTWYPDSPPTQLDPDDLRDDLPLLRTALFSAYAGWDTAIARGWDWDAWFSRWDQLLSQHHGQPMSTADALAPFRELLLFQRDNVTAPTGFEAGHCGSLCVWAGRKLPADCDAVRSADGHLHPLNRGDAAQVPRTAWIMLPSGPRVSSYLSCPADYGDLRAIRSRGRWLPLYRVWNPRPDECLQNILSFTGISTDLPTYKNISNEIGYLRLPTMDLQGRQFLGQVLALGLEMRQRKLLIVDLRDSAGDAATIDQLAPVVGLPTLQRPGRARTYRQSCLSVAFGWGECQEVLATADPVTREQFANAQAALEAIDGPAPDGVSTERSAGDWDYRRHAAQRGARAMPGHPRVLVLVDNLTRGYAERLLWQLSALPGSVIAGSNTYGEGGFTDPGGFLLPHSRIGLRVARGSTDAYGDGRSLDAYGFDVDVVLPTRESQLPSALLHLADVLAAHAGFSL